MWPQIARIAPVFTCLAISMTSCTSDAPSDQEVLISLTDEVVVPAYQAVASDMAWLDHEVKKLCETPSDASLVSTTQPSAGPSSYSSASSFTGRSSAPLASSASVVPT